MVALGVVFAMVTKPSYAGAFGALAGFAAIGTAGAVPLWRRPAPEAESQPAA
jgi:hypothetical protein